MKKTNNKLIYILSGAVVMLIVILIMGKKQGWIGAEKAQEVEISEVKKGNITEKVSASGKIHPVAEVKISPDVSGEIVELNIEEGDSVTKGQLLLRIRPDNYKSLLDQAVAGLNSSKATLAQAESRHAQAKANFIKAQQDFNRNKSLHEQKVISQSEYETAETSFNVSKEELEAAHQAVKAAQYNVQSADARIVDARENLNKTNIYAPVSGTVSKLSVKKGERVVGTSQMAGTELLRIANLANMEVRVNVNENDIVRVSIGDTTVIEVESYSREGDKFYGVVSAIAHTANDVASLDAVTEFEVKIKILNQSYQKLVTNEKPFPFRPGMTATVDIITESKKNILIIPISAVTVRTKENDENATDEIVFVVSDDMKAQQRTVKTGISDFDAIEITEGLKEGEKVVSGPFQQVSKNLKDGDLVKKSIPKSEKKKEKSFGVSVEVN